ncbi:hypothetical protein F2Q70_00035002 [Brassica cretica]|uniref:Uncharacterized protein n=1 Tax=Brassica cretica TaxID=69181 RepID=A0A8S9JWG1_BRACR|nr:hypothetical protein F2Q70_00035002 [Brassica cretica]
MRRTDEFQAMKRHNNVLSHHAWTVNGQKILDGNTEVAPVATRVHVNGLKERLRGLFPLEKKTRKMHISFCETPSNVSVNHSELESDAKTTLENRQTLVT